MNATLQALVCSVSGCERPIRVKKYQLCGMHHSRFLRTGDPEATRRKRNVCTIDGCEKPCAGRGWCRTHYDRWYKRGDAEALKPWRDLPDGMRWCSGLCKGPVDADLFTPGHNMCRPCAAAKIRERRLSDPDLDRRYLDPEKERARQRRYNEQHPGYSAERRRRYTARKRQAQIEVVSYPAVLERDAWTCGICGTEIDRGLRHPHPASASVDHIVPLNKGGAHSYANCQAAHFGCNSSKGDKMAVA